MKRMRIPSDNLPRCGQQIIKRLLAIGKNQKWLAAQCKVCLLYTSDAADEL